MVAYLLNQKEGMEIMGSLDNDGKTPLDVCLESKSNYWKATSELLEEAYQECVSYIKNSGNSHRVLPFL